ncbi:TolB family protein [Pleomorphovibrio marinus]|uniref:TolB family protein n=1 Tax=Pleomorphovibrio marinus TaxID=2164132 RepID=UPI000E0AB871|nr:PD40 domain-containing protein [Pleomorphovibrio marinus]
MKKFHLLVLLGIVCISCEREWDDPIPEGAVLGAPYLVAELTEEGKVLLNWGFNRLCAGWLCPHTVDGSRYEVYWKFPGADDFVRLAQLGEEERSFMVDNLEYGVPYEFNMKTFRAGHMTTSNRIMIVPNPIPAYETLMELDNWDPILNPKINSPGDKVAFVSNYRWAQGSQDFMTLSLFLHDLVSGQTELVKQNSYHPQWSADGQRILYGTTDGKSQIAQGYFPSQLETYNVETKAFRLVITGQYQQYFPSFGKDDDEVLFLSDSLERGEMGLWKTDSSGDTEVLWPSFQLPEHGAGLPLFTGLDASNFRNLVALDRLSTVENRSVYTIYGVEFGEGVQKKAMVESRWNDMAPAFSPFDEKLLAFVSDRSGSRQVWTIDISTGKLNQVTFFQEGAFISGTSLSWIDGGQSLVVPISSSQGVSQLVKVNVIT